MVILKRYLILSDGKEHEVKRVVQNGKTTEVFTIEPTGKYTFYNDAPFTIVERVRTFDKVERELGEALKLYQTRPQTILFTEPENPTDWEGVFVKAWIGFGATCILVLLSVGVYLMFKALPA